MRGVPRSLTPCLCNFRFSLQDWFHESCLSLRERPLSRASTPEAGVPAQEVDDAASEASSNDLPPPLIRADNYDALICAACVRSIPVVRRYAGTPGALMVVRDVPGGPWSVIGREAESGANVEVETVEARKGLDTGVGEKRARSPTKGESDAPNAKRARVSPEASSSPPCLAPPVNSLAQQIFDKSLSKMDGAATSSGEEDVCGEGDIFLTEGFRDRWCQCSSVRASVPIYLFRASPHALMTVLVIIRNIPMPARGRRDIRAPRGSRLRYVKLLASDHFRAR